MANSSQSRIGRVRPPRVQITYDVEDGGATESRELPLVAAVVSDLSGDGTDPLAYGEREFVEVEQGGIDPLMKQIKPTLKFPVADRISGGEGEIAVELEFASLDDFSPMGIAEQLPSTAHLLEVRQQLADLYGKIEANEKLDGILGEILADEDKQGELKRALGLDEEGASA